MAEALNQQLASLTGKKRTYPEISKSHNEEEGAEEQSDSAKIAHLK